MAIALLAAVLAALFLAGSGPAELPRSFIPIDRGPSGGTAWQGVIQNRYAPLPQRQSIVYLPPHAEATGHYPVLFLLQGFVGSPWQFTSGLRLAQVADRLISTGRIQPFVAVIPPAKPHYVGEWAGIWEKYLVHDVVPWANAHLPISRARRNRGIAGLSAGGYGAVDIGLRHPLLFGTLESWSGYFRAPHDGPLAHARKRELEAHDPSLLVRRRAAELRRLGTRFFISSGTRHDRVSARDARRFSRELASLGLPHELALRPGGHDGKLWRAQLPAALGYALRVGSFRDVPDAPMRHFVVS